MGLNPNPAARITANSQDVTEAIIARLKSLRIVDEAGTTADTLEIRLADNKPAERIAIPATGAELRVSLGYMGEDLRDFGLFILDEVELSGFPDEMILRARAAPYDASTGGKKDLQTQKSRSWRKGTTLGAMVKKIASEHGLTPAVDAALASVKLPHVDQSHESDMNLLSRLAKQYDAIAKPAAGRLLFIRRGDGKSASGAELATVTVDLFDRVSDYRVSIKRRDSAGTVVARWRDLRGAKCHDVSVGDGDPVKRMRHVYPDAASARAAATAEQRKRAREEKTLTLSLVGRPDAIAEAPLTLTGFREGIPTEWIAKRVEHELSPEGYRTTVEAELPNSDADVSASTATVSEGELPSVGIGGD